MQDPHLNQGSPGSNALCCHFEAWAISLCSRRPCWLRCLNEYKVPGYLDGGGNNYVSEWSSCGNRNMAECFPLVLEWTGGEVWSILSGPMDWIPHYLQENRTCKIMYIHSLTVQWKPCWCWWWLSSVGQIHNSDEMPLVSWIPRKLLG